MHVCDEIYLILIFLFHFIENVYITLKKNHTMHAYSNYLNDISINCNFLFQKFDFYSFLLRKFLYATFLLGFVIFIKKNVKFQQLTHDVTILFLK
jgi:hypothetical protein